MKKEVYEFISKKTSDPIVERRICCRTGKDFPIYQSDIDMLNRITPSIGGKKYNYGLPTLSHKSRFQRMMMFRNERTLYRRKCDLTGKSIVSLYAPEYPGKVYSPDAWWGDKWDALIFGKNIETGNFLEQFRSLFLDTPMLNLFATKNENSEYVNGAQENKDCYMIFASDYDENCFYDYSVCECKDVVDSYGSKGCENCYEIIDCLSSMKTFFSQKISNSFNIYFSYNIISCNNIFLCVGLKDKEYYFMNEFVGKERWKTEIAPMIRQIFAEAKYDEYQKKLKQMLKGTIVQSMNIINTQNGIGDLIENSKNVFDSYEIHDAEDIKGVINANKCKDIMGGYVVVDDSQKVCEGVSIISNYLTSTVRNSRHNVKNSHRGVFITNLENSIGCVSLSKKEYCILNKQYTKDEREPLAKEIIGELQEKGKRGEFFNPDFSPFPYNDTVAYEYFPVKSIISDGQETIINPEGIGSVNLLQPEKFVSDAVLDFGGEEKIKTKWRTKEQEINVPAEFQKIKAEELPKNINELNDDILEKVIICEISGRPFRLVAPELAFYRKHGLSVPSKHPDIRHQERFNKRPGRNLYLRKCDNCDQEALSVYPTDSEFKVYCGDCYEKEIYG